MTSTKWPEEFQIFMGLDCSSKAIHSIVLNLDETILTSHKWASNKKTFTERFPLLLKDFWEDISRMKVTLTSKQQIFATVEESIYIQNPRTTVQLASVVGCVKFGCYYNGLHLTGVNNRHWKKTVLGNGNASKQDIMKFAVEKWGDVFEEQDFADAACIALWGVQNFKSREVTSEKKE